MADRMECLRLALGQRYDDAKPLTPDDADQAMAVAEKLYQWACQGMEGEAKPVIIEGVMSEPPRAAYALGLDG